MIECPYVKRNANQIRGFYMTKNIILMADSQEINRRTLTHILQNEYELLEADSVDQTLERMYKYGQQIAAVILDLADCERLDGYEVLMRWRKDAQFVRFLSLCQLTLTIGKVSRRACGWVFGR